MKTGDRLYPTFLFSWDDIGIQLIIKSVGNMKNPCDDAEWDKNQI
jgi:hypothetical protein